VLSIVLATAIAAGQPGPAALPRIAQDEFKILLAKRNVVTVDVRDERDFREGHIPGAVSLPLAAFLESPARFDRTIARLRASQNPIVTYCACNGESSSLRVAALLEERGIAGVRALTGGWADWINGGNRIEKGRSR
jgi:rhodanese-related sulfurtransferase